MLWLGAVLITGTMAGVAYGWLFANRPAGQRIALSIAVAILTPVVLFVLMAIVVALTFSQS